MDKTFAEKLKEARALTGLSQQGMADRMLIPKKTIQKWEIADRVPPEYVQRFVLNELQDIAKTGTPIVDRAVYERAQERTKKDGAYMPPLGYKMQDGKPVKNEEEAEIVKRAMDEMARDGNLSPETEKDLREAWKKHYGLELTLDRPRKDKT